MKSNCFIFKAFLVSVFYQTDAQQAGELSGVQSETLSLSWF
ncbi:MAG: hypothetical protein ACJAWM_001366 [Sulfitobacter sp.]|jgi:hypothetical protein